MPLDVNIPKKKNHEVSHCSNPSPTEGGYQTSLEQHPRAATSLTYPCYFLLGTDISGPPTPPRVQYTSVTELICSCIHFFFVCVSYLSYFTERYFHIPASLLEQSSYLVSSQPGLPAPCLLMSFFCMLEICSYQATA